MTINAHMRKAACIVLLLLMISLASLACAQSGNPLWDSYQQQPAQPVDGQAYLELIPFTTPIAPIHSGNPVYPIIWQFGLFVKEVNGVPFTLEKLTATRFDADHNAIIDVTYEGEEILMYFPATYLESGEPYMHIVHQPLDETAFYGLRYEGVDANGNPGNFSILLPLIAEPEPPKTPDGYVARSEGDTLVSLSASENPVLLAPHEFFGGNYGWSYDLIVTNVSDAPVTLDHLSLVYFDGENVRYQYAVDGTALADWAYADSHIIAPGESLALSDICPQQPLTTIGYLFHASDESGRKQVVSMSVETSQDIRAEE